jgi:hypothetical protein
LLDGFDGGEGCAVEVGAELGVLYEAVLAEEVREFAARDEVVVLAVGFARAW